MTDRKQELTADHLREVLSYDPDTGVFRWKARVSSNSRAKIGAIAGSVDSKGYRQIMVAGSLRLAHRLAWLYVNGEWPTDQIDHIDGDRMNNAIVNLRNATHGENQQNILRARKMNKTGFLGVSTKKRGYIARIQIDGKQISTGTFDTPEEAHAAYLKAKRQLHPFGTL